MHREKTTEKDNQSYSDIRINKRLRGKKIYALLSVIVIAATVTLIYFNNPSGEGCVFESVFGIYAPSCGITRATYSLLHLDFVQAFYYNQFYTLSVLPLFYVYATYVINTLFAKKIVPMFKIRGTYVAVYFLLFLLYGIMRNIPGLEILQPTVI